MADWDPSDRWRELLSDDPRRIKKNNMAPLVLQQLKEGQVTSPMDTKTTG